MSLDNLLDEIAQNAQAFSAGEISMEELIERGHAIGARAKEEGISPEEFDERAIELASKILSPPDDPHNIDKQFGTFKDTLDDKDVRLEVIDQPLYDAQTVVNPCFLSRREREQAFRKDGIQVVFFQTPGGRHLSEVNVQTAGQLSWPKRFYIRGIAFSFDRPLAPKQVDEMYATLTIGEKNYLTLPLAEFHYRQDNIDGERAMFRHIIGKTYNVAEEEMLANYNGPKKGFKSPAASIYIPPVQNFTVKLTMGKTIGGEMEVRCRLDGLLAREIC